MGEYIKVGKMAKENIIQRKMIEHGSAQHEIFVGETADTQKRIKGSSETGVWLSTMLECLNSSMLSTKEFRDKFPFCFSSPPHRSPVRCNRYKFAFTFGHKIACKKGILVHQCHDIYALCFFLLSDPHLQFGEQKPLLKHNCTLKGV